MQGTGSGAGAENICSDGSYARSATYSYSAAPVPSWLAERRRRPSLPARRTCNARGYLLHCLPHAVCLYSACKAVDASLGRSAVRCKCALLSLRKSSLQGRQDMRLP